MAKAMLVAMVSPEPGHEAEFDAWYEYHLQEVGNVPGIFSAQRMRLSALQVPLMPAPEQENLVFFEIDGDVEQVIAELVRRRRDGVWVPRQGLSQATLRMWVYDLVTPGGRPLD